MKSLKSFTFLISGPIGTRLPEPLLSEQFAVLGEISQRTGMNIALATYDEEPVASWILKMSQITRISDPGPDQTKKGIGDERISTRNTSRMLASTVAGLRNVKTEYVIKSRIEVMPKNPKFESSIERAFEVFEVNPESLIGFMPMHYQGLHKNFKNVMFFITDIFQIMRTKQAIALWEDAQTYWETYGGNWMGRHNPIANEQIMGLSLAKLMNQELRKEEIESFFRYKVTREMFLIQQDWENRSIFTLKSLRENLFDSRLTFINFQRRQLDEQVFPNPKERAYKYFYFRAKNGIFRLLRNINSYRAHFKILTKVYWENKIARD